MGASALRRRKRSGEGAPDYPYRHSRPGGGAPAEAPDAARGGRMIAEFKGEDRFLSNFYPVQVTVGGITYPTAEHAFQAQKASSLSDHRAIAALASPQLAKQRGRKLDLPENWDR